MANDLSPSFPTGMPDIPGGGGFGSAPRVPALGGFSPATSVRVRDMQGRFNKGGWGFGWDNLEGVMDLPAKFEAGIVEAINKNLDALADEMVEYAKANAPWEDRSGDARDGLHTSVVSDVKSGMYYINLGYSVVYGVYLEHANGGAYAIVGPTVRMFAPRVAGAAIAGASASSASGR